MMIVCNFYWVIFGGIALILLSCWLDRLEEKECEEIARESNRRFMEREAKKESNLPK